MIHFFAKKWIISERHSPNVNTQNGIWIRWRKGLTGPQVRSVMWLTTRALQVSSPLPMKSKPRTIYLYLNHKVSVKALKGSMGGMAYRPTSKVVAPSRTCWSHPRKKTPWSAKVGSYIGSSVVTLPVMMNT